MAHELLLLLPSRSLRAGRNFGLPEGKTNRRSTPNRERSPP